MLLIWRVLATIAAINLFVLAVFVGLSVLQYNKIQSDLIRERLIALVDIVRDPFEAVANLGLPLGTVRNADAVLERARLSDDSIVAIFVIGADGDIAQATPAQIAPDLRSMALSAGPELLGSSIWKTETPDSFLIGTSIRSAAGAAAGSIILAYSKRDALTQVQAMTGKLFLIAGGLLIATVGAGLIVLRVVLGEHVRIFDGILATFDSYERRFWRGSASTVTEVPDIAGLGLRTSEFRDLIERSEAEYRQALPDTAEARPAGPET